MRDTAADPHGDVRGFVSGGEREVLQWVAEAHKEHPPMPQAATIKSLPRAMRMMKTMQAQGIEWGEDYRHAAGDALKGILAGRMAAEIDRHLDEMAARGQADRRNGSYARHLLTELGDIELCVPRTRHYSSIGVVRAYARRARQLDRMILACFVLGLSTRKVATALLPVLGRRISAAT